MKVDGSIGSLIQGVSQQPARERLPGQCTLQENFSSDPVDGLKRRPPKEWLNTLLNSSDNYYFSDYDGGDLGKFVIAHAQGDIKVFDLEGNPYDMVLTGDTTYLPDGPLEFIGVDDKIYIVDPSVIVTMLPDTKSYVSDGSIVFLLGGQYGRVYGITIRWKNALGVETTKTITHGTPDGSVATDIYRVATSDIAAYLLSYLNADATLSPLFDFTISDDVILIRKKPAADVVSYAATVSDGDGGNNMFVVNNSAKDAGGLPRYAPQGYVVSVAGADGNSADNYYLEFYIDVDANGYVTPVGGGFGRDGKWIECVAPDIEYKFDPLSMPHVLQKTDTTEFTYLDGAWEDRRVGDDTTNPLPSFVGKTITDIGSFQGRLTFLADVNLIMSRTYKPTDFFNQSATVLADDDPIDIASALGTFVLRKLVPHNRDLVVFADNAQFIVFGRNSLTPRNASLVLTTEFETDLRAAPVSAGKNIAFAFKYGQFTGVQEFFTEGTEDANNARPITQHVLQYITGTPLQLISTTNFSKILVRTSTDKKNLYVYEYIWLDNQKAQASWSTWKFSREIQHAFFVDSFMYLIGKDGDDYHLYVMNLDDTPDEGVTYRACLDEKIILPAVTTTFTVPYAVDDIENYIAVQGEGCPHPGMRATIESFIGDEVTLTSDMDGGSVVFGRKYLSRYIPTPPQVKDRNNVKIGSGKMTIKNYTVHFDETGYLKALITDRYGYSAEVEYSGRVIGDPNNVIGEPAVSDGAFTIPFKKDPDRADLEIQSESHLPLQMLELEWLGQWRKKGTRIGG